MSTYLMSLLSDCSSDVSDSDVPIFRYSRSPNTPAQGIFLLLLPTLPPFPRPSLFPRAMTADNYNPEWDDYDPAFLAFIARLDLNDTGTALPPQPPRTPSPTLESDAVHRHTFPSMDSRRSDSNTPNPTVYQFESPTRCGSTTHWCVRLLFWFPFHQLKSIFHRSLAGSATQGVANAHVRAIQTGGRRKKPRTHIAAYTVFCGRQHGVFKTWWRPLSTNKLSLISGIISQG